jgi:hypothetical protein
MATRREPSAAVTDGAITNASFLHNEIYFHPGFASKLSFEKVEFGRCVFICYSQIYLSVKL